MDPRRQVSGSRLLFCLCALLSAHPAGAHREEFPKRDQLRIQPDRLALRIEYVVPASDEADALRRLFDRDRSGALDAREQQALLDHLYQQATAFARLELDGQPQPLQKERAELGPIGTRSDALTAILTLGASVALTSGRRHQLRFFDRHKDRSVMVPVRIVAPELRILTALPPLPLISESHPLKLQFEVGPSPGGAR